LSVEPEKQTAASVCQIGESGKQFAEIESLSAALKTLVAFEVFAWLEAFVAYEVYDVSEVLVGANGM